MILNRFFFTVFSSGCHFVQLFRSVCAILVEDIVGNLSVTLFEIKTDVVKWMLF